VFAAAEADLQPQPVRAGAESASQVRLQAEGAQRVRRLRFREAQAGQGGVQQQLLPGPQRMAPRAAIQAVGGVLQRVRPSG